MKEQYDFSKGERGKFYRKNAKLNLPIYLDDDVLQFVEGVAKKKKMDIQTVVNRLLKNDIKVAELLQWIAFSEQGSARAQRSPSRWDSTDR